MPLPLKPRTSCRAAVRPAAHHRSSSKRKSGIDTGRAGGATRWICWSPCASAVIYESIARRNGWIRKRWIKFAVGPFRMPSWLLSGSFVTYAIIHLGRCLYRPGFDAWLDYGTQ
jgi:hypothetical protein